MKDDEKYICKVQCMQTNDLFEMWEGCPFLEKKYLVSVSTSESS